MRGHKVLGLFDHLIIVYEGAQSTSLISFVVLQCKILGKNCFRVLDDDGNDDDDLHMVSSTLHKMLHGLEE